MDTLGCFYGTSLALRASAEIIFLPAEKRFLVDHGGYFGSCALLCSVFGIADCRVLVRQDCAGRHVGCCRRQDQRRPALPSAGCVASSQRRLVPSSAEALR